MAARGFSLDRPRDSLNDIRSSLDSTGHAPNTYDDKDILDEEEEVEHLVRRDQGGSGLRGLLSKYRDTAPSASLESREKHAQHEGKFARSWRRRRRKSGYESTELIHDMEDGANRSSSDMSDASLDDDDDGLLGRPLSRKTSRSNLSCGRIAGVHIVVLVAFAGILYGAFVASRRSKTPYTPTTLSNGTHSFQPTTILISLDGFRADFLNRGLTPHLNQLVREGVSPEYMLPSFPSVTFPNHFTLVTGLYPESHGIVGNTFWDPVLNEEFYYTDPERSMHPRFWQAEPIWTTAEKADLRSAIHMWPGSEAHIGEKEPAYVDKFNSKEPLPKKVDRILSLIDLPGPESPSSYSSSPRPQLIAAYVPNVDADGHKYGPNSTEIRSTITAVDSMIGSLMSGLAARNLTSVVNVIVVSDHGMATTSTNRLIQLDDLIDTSQITHSDGWPLYGLRPAPGVGIIPLYNTLKGHAAASGDSFAVYLKDHDMPERYHFSANPRIAPLWIVPAPGWAIVTKADFDVEASKASGAVYHPRGLHGYDHEHPLMRAIFIARGPAFPHKPGSRIKPFQNTEVYGLVCDSLGLARQPNNGTLHLPLTTDGVHDNPGGGDETADLPADDHEPAPPESDAKGWDGLQEMPAPSDDPSANTLLNSTSGIDVQQQNASASSSGASGTSTTTTSLPGPAPTPEMWDSTDEKPADMSWWDWFKAKLEEAEAWAKSLTNHKGEGPVVEGDVRPTIVETSSAQAVPTLTVTS